LLSVAELEERLIAVDAGVVLAPSRIVRRVIKKHARLAGVGLQVPHRKSYILRRDELFAIVSREELDLAPERSLPPTVVLLPLPAAGKLAVLPRGDLLRKYARFLFHVHIHRAFHLRRRDGHLSAKTMRDRIRLLGATEFAEVKAVLTQEHFLLPPGDDVQVYE